MYESEGTPPQPPALEHIMVTLDGSRLAEEVLPYVETLAQKMGSRVTVVWVVTGLEALLLAQSRSDDDCAAEVSPVQSTPDAVHVREHPAEYLAKVQQHLQSRGIAVDSETPEGWPGAVIVERARQLGVDVIAMTTHGHGGLARLVNGSVADEVLRHAPCPVFLVRSRLAE